MLQHTYTRYTVKNSTQATTSTAWMTQDQSQYDCTEATAPYKKSNKPARVVQTETGTALELSSKQKLHAKRQAVTTTSSKQRLYKHSFCSKEQQQ